MNGRERSSPKWLEKRAKRERERGRERARAKGRENRICIKRVIFRRTGKSVAKGSQVSNISDVKKKTRFEKGGNDTLPRGLRNKRKKNELRTKRNEIFIRRDDPLNAVTACALWSRGNLYISTRR